MKVAHVLMRSNVYTSVVLQNIKFKKYEDI